MIFEYALQPSVLLSWSSNRRDYSEFLREYGLGTRRIISSFPKKKASKLRSYLLQHSPADEQSLQGQRYTEMVLKIVETLVFRDVAHFESEWPVAVVEENSRAPFGVIFSSESVDVEHCITPETMYDEGSIWECKGQLDIQRTNEGLYSAIENLVLLSSERIEIIDPFAWTRQGIAFIQFLLNSLSRDGVNHVFPSVDIFYKEKRGGINTGRGSSPAEYVKTNIVAGLEADVSNIEINVFELQEKNDGDVFHNRCILTEHGGVMTGHGIGVSGEEGHTDEAVLMESHIYKKKWRQFVEEPCFDVASNA